ncbi:MAG: hypothetical protein ACI8UO_002681 [Verrucomicrobiales bacterium]
MVSGGKVQRIHFEIEVSDLTRDRLIVGLEAEIRPDGLGLLSDKQKDGAAALRDGDSVPFRSKVDQFLDQISTGRTVVVVAVGAVVILLLFFVLKWVFHGATVVFALILAAGTAAVAHPFATPFVKDLYQKVEQADSEQEGPLKIERPNPQVASILVTGVAAFLGWSILIGAAFRKSKGGGGK